MKLLNPIIRKFSNELHSLRGIAALVVVLFHLRGVLNEIFHQNFTNIFNGSACVLLFFVLSGLVVTSSVIKAQKDKHFLSKYYLRRLFRLMPLMILTVTIGGIFLTIFKFDLPLPLYDKTWGDFNALTWVVSYVGYSLKANPPSWSIWIELVASLLLPAFLLIKKDWLNITIFAIALIALTFLQFKSQHYWHFYLISFYVGATILYWGEMFANYIYKLLPTKGLYYSFVFLLAIMFYMPRILFPNWFWVGNNLIVLWETMFIAPIVALIYYMPGMFNLLNHKSLVFFGNISFSIYLNHMILMVIFFNIYLVNFKVSALVVAALIPFYLLLVIITSIFTYKYVELKGSELGQKIITKLGLSK